MRTSIAFLLLTLIPLWTSCASKPIALAPVGPRPLIGRPPSLDTGYLQVFSALEGVTEGNNPTFFQHADYYIYDAAGTRVKHVDNTVGAYQTTPRLVTLPPGNYTVTARAATWPWMIVPVVVERGRTTKVHLDGHWRPPPATPESEIVSAPGGSAVGWRANVGTVQAPG